MESERMNELGSASGSLVAPPLRQQVWQLIWKASGRLIRPPTPPASSLLQPDLPPACCEPIDVKELAHNAVSP